MIPSFQHKDEVNFYLEDKILRGTVILQQSNKVLVACGDDLAKLRFIPIDWHTGKHTYEDMIESWGTSHTTDRLYEARIKPLNGTHLFKWFNHKELVDANVFTLEQLLKRLENETR